MCCMEGDSSNTFLTTRQLTTIQTYLPSKASIHHPQSIVNQQHTQSDPNKQRRQFHNQRRKYSSMRNEISDSVQAEATIYLQQQSSHHAIDVHDDELQSGSPDRRLAVLQRKLNTPPRILSRSAGRPTCSIFKVPQTFVEVNGKHYQPRILSVGPFHRGKPHLQMIQEHKYNYLSLLLKRSNLTLKALFQTLEPVENIAREAYSEEFDLDRHDFIELLVVDGCFIIELFRKVARLVPIERDDPIFSLSWILYFLTRDLLLLENQLPFFVLQKLFDRTMGATDKEKSENASLADIFFGCLHYTCDRPQEVIQSLRRFQAKHLLDLCRTSFIPRDEGTKDRDIPPRRTGGMPSHVIHCISKLRRAGIKIRTPKNNGSSTFLAVKFRRNGVIEMPTVIFDDFMCSFFANCVAYEISQYKCPRYFTTYTTLLDYLVNSHKDVEYLSDHNIIENYIGADIEVADFINNLGKDTPLDDDNCYLREVFDQVNHYHENSWHVHLASFKYTYFRTPWSFVSAVAALVLLVLSVLQTVYSVLSYFNQKDQSSN